MGATLPPETSGSIYPVMQPFQEIGLFYYAAARTPALSTLVLHLQVRQHITVKMPDCGPSRSICPGPKGMSVGIGYRIPMSVPKSQRRASVQG